MAGFGTATNRPLYGRGSAPGLRFTIYAGIALALMYFDQRDHWSQRLRYGFLAAAYPVQVAISSPARGWKWLNDLLGDRDALRAENERLLASQRALQVQALQLDALLQENAQLRALRESLPPLVKKWLLAEVISIETTPLRQRLVINKGARDGVFINEAVVDGSGILGQVASIGPWSAEVILITDPQHALPVQVSRNGLRSIAVGSGSVREMLLPYLAVNSDVKSGDQLFSSGLGGVFPAGYPVATISGVTRENNQVLAQVRATPLAHIDGVREVMLIEFDPTHPNAPVKPPPPPAPPPPPEATAAAAAAAAATPAAKPAATPAAPPATAIPATGGEPEPGSEDPAQ